MITRWLSVLACAGLLAAQQRSPIDAAWDLLAKGDRAGAVRVLQKIIKANPRDGERGSCSEAFSAKTGKDRRRSLNWGRPVRLLAALRRWRTMRWARHFSVRAI